MIYLGLIHFNNSVDHTDNLLKSLFSLTSHPPSVIKKGSLTLCYSKISSTHDFDDIWDSDYSILLGRVFDKLTNRTFSKEKFKKFSYHEKEDCLKRFWGKYIYFNLNKDSAVIDIILDPTGQLPFFYHRFPNGNILFSSHVELIYKVLNQKPEYNWEYLCSYLIYGNSSATQTPFKNIYELPPACSLKITVESLNVFPYWNPLQFYKPENSQDKNVLDVLNITLQSWINPYQNIVVSLSGGLDSSSLVYCLKDLVRKDQTLKAINYFHSKIQTSNEFHYAQKVCDEVGIELIGIDASDTLPFDPPQQTPIFKPNKPFPGFISLRWMETIVDHLPSQESFAFISGHGSDHIFMRPPTKNSLSDFLIEMRFKGSKRKLEEIAQFYRDPLFTIIKENVKSLTYYLLGMRKEKRFLNEKAKDLPFWLQPKVIQRCLTSFSHPIYEKISKKTLPGKYDQIDAFYEGLSSIHIEIMSHAEPTYYPFLYQPMVEYALSLPTYQLFEQGYDRYHLRNAISKHFKTETIWRRDKSQTTGLFQLGLKRNIKNILELCLEGQLAKKEFVDREKLQQTIHLIANGDTKFMWPLIYIASTELFLKSWEDKPYG